MTSIPWIILAFTLCFGQISDHQNFQDQQEQIAKLRFQTIQMQKDINILKYGEREND